jgi:DivIVA domain-containing protein
MSATELDLPVLITAEQIRRREFVTTRRGYDPDQVRPYLESLADQVDLMASMIRDARMETESLLRSDSEPKPDPYEQLARRVTGVIRSADEAAERFRHEARRDAEALMTEARADAERIRTEAKGAADEARAHAERALLEAKEQANRTIAGLSTRRDAVVEQLAEMRERLLGVAQDLEATIIEPLPAPTDAVGDAATVDEPTMPAVPATSGQVIRLMDAPLRGATPPSPDAMSIEALFADLDDGTHDELWDGTDAAHLEVPDIPPLDLDWGPDLDEDDLR